MRSTALPFSALLFLASIAGAQDPRADAAIAKARSALAPLAALAGQWEGEASIVTGPGTSLRIAQSEDITWGANGTLLLIKGTGRGTEGATKGAVVFEAVATLWFDAGEGRLRMRTFRDGASVEPELEVRPDTLIWGFEVPGGRVRYTIAFGNDTWHEVGEFLRPQAAPIRTIDMRLSRRTP